MVVNKGILDIGQYYYKNAKEENLNNCKTNRYTELNASNYSESKFYMVYVIQFFIFKNQSFVLSFYFKEDWSVKIKCFS